MKQAVVFHLSNANWGVIDAYLARSGQYALVTREETLSAPELTRHAGKIAALASLLSPKEKQSADEYIRSVLGRSPYLFVGKDWEELCARHGMPSDTMRQAMRQDLAAEWSGGALLIEGLERSLSHYSIRALVLNEEYSADAVALAAWAGQRRIPVLHIDPGLAMDGDYLDSGDLRADAVTVCGPRAAEAYQDMGVPSSRVLQTGNPGWVKYAELAALKSECRAGLAKLLGWGPGPLVVFGTASTSVLPASSDPERLSRAARAFFRCAREIPKSRPDSIWAVLLESADPAGLENELKAWAAEEGLAAGVIRFFRNDSELFLTAADAVISMDSSLTVEALLAGTTAINVLSEEGWRMGPSFAADTGVLEVPPEGIREAVLGALERRGADPRGLEAAKAAYHPAQNGDPIKNVVDWISGMLAPVP